ncbi:MAG TPA: ABC transporter permease, partial [Cyclobacteriaceae bacterium]|nr:ABC transporter permease [Cyclobacteriaceae bacterium]
MLRNYFKVAYRNFTKESLYSFINVTGLATGIACSLLIFLYVSDELSYDRYHSNAGKIYRVNEFFEPADGSGERSSSIPFPMGEALVVDYPNMVKEAVRFFDFQAPTITVVYEQTEKEFNERNFFFVDSTYHKVFDLHLLKGNPEVALNNPNSVIITESAAKKYFGEEEPMGKLLRCQDRVDLLVTGVMPDWPLNSHFRADFLASFSTLRNFFGGQLPSQWYWNPCWTYLLLEESTDVKDLEAKLPEFVQKHMPEFIRNDVYLKLQPLTDIHLTSNLQFEIEPNSSEANIYLFSGVAIFVLLIACINFMNLSTARAMNRAKEVAMRKTVGGQKHQLMFQFLMESVLMCFLAVILSLVVVYFSLFWFNNFAGKDLSLDLMDPTLLFWLTVTGIVVGVIAGIYPAAVLTSFNPVKALRAKKAAGKGFSFRKALVVAQFSISIVLIIGTGVAIQQLNFLQNDEVGFTKDHIIMIPVIRTPMAQKYQSYVDEALKNTGIHSITAVEEILGAKYQGANYQFEGMKASSLFSRLNVRHDFLKTFEIPLLAGRDYSRDITTDDSLALVVNETLVKSFGWTAEEALTKYYDFGPYRGRIVGVTKDFNFSSKHEPIGPIVLPLNTFPGAFNLFIKYMAVRISPTNTQASIEALEKLWKSMLPGRPFEYFFLDNELTNLYKAEANLSRVAGTFSVLAIVVACLGLFGLASFNAEQRKKEIGIRKVLGSSVSQIILLIFSDYSRLLLAAIIIGCP